MKVYLIRHYATQGNLEKRYVGSTDECLLESSIRELKVVGKKTLWNDMKEILLFVSPLKRCIQTANLLFPHREQIVVENLRECYFGEFEYKNYEELNGNSAYQRFIDTAGASGFPGGETKSEFQKRCTQAFEQIIKEYQMEESLAFVVHGGTIMSILDTFSKPHQDYYDWQLRNGEAYVMDVTMEEGTPICSNVRRFDLPKE